MCTSQEGEELEASSARGGDVLRKAERGLAVAMGTAYLAIRGDLKGTVSLWHGLVGRLGNSWGTKARACPTLLLICPFEASCR